MSFARFWARPAAAVEPGGGVRRKRDHRDSRSTCREDGFDLIVNTDQASNLWGRLGKRGCAFRRL